MKELSEIVAALETLRESGKPAALATVIAVEGSAYRRPGARMLVSAEGRTWGGVSGGCLERDVARRALGVIETGRPVRCRYDTGDEDAVAAGTSTGCGGTVEIFIQLVDANAPGPIPFFARVLASRKPVAIYTVLRPAGANFGQRAGHCASIEDATDCRALTSLGIPVRAYLRNGTPARIEGDAITGEYFLERLLPPQALVVFGAGFDAVPVVSIAKALGWHVTVVGSRPATATFERFGAADTIHITPSHDPLEGVLIPPDAAVVMMTHNLERDTAILARLHGPLAYLGILGPRHRTRQLLDDLPGGRVRGVLPSRFFAPVGLDLGAQTPEEIALAVVAEIQSVVRRASGRPLRACPGPLHREAPAPALDASIETNRPDDRRAAIDPARRSPACPA